MTKQANGFPFCNFGTVGETARRVHERPHGLESSGQWRPPSRGGGIQRWRTCTAATPFASLTLSTPTPRTHMAISNDSAALLGLPCEAMLLGARTDCVPSADRASLTSSIVCMRRCLPLPLSRDAFAPSVPSAHHQPPYRHSQLRPFLLLRRPLRPRTRACCIDAGEWVLLTCKCCLLIETTRSGNDWR